ncbi:sigma-54-dependent Fis family transcriptional regulator [Marinobacter sp. TBZ242]|uniref:Sigma-54-dependent Fis family transcriptional regulator n=1 Tax=Marinobacter azerbaijanicus TaxID=3050455 RepID=A0ABT7I761_9GAMM|nr:sigma-54-dependent Fis family transcriptional regulator [Marinobacter sp. TBZ242]MDL0429910.1 sigma-54-dependent Fis family transcriptional regulator [Marinobacter sp. TBZ242]
MKRQHEQREYRSVIADSWNRCIGYGLHHDHEPEPASLDETAILGLEQEYETLLSTTETEVLPYYNNIMSNSRCLILLADSGAQVLKGWGDRRITETRLRPYFCAGSSWHERYAGTNAIGTAVATGSPIQVQRNEHFLKLNRSIIGSAAPIFDTDRTLIGVLSAFSDAYLPQAHTLGMVRLLSQSVENRLIVRQLGSDHFILTLNATADNIDSPWSGLIAFDHTGRIAASNQRADQLLGDALQGRNLSSLFMESRNLILNHSETAAIQLTTTKRVRLSGLLKRPGRIKTPHQKPTTRPTERTRPTGPHLETVSIDDIEHGEPSVRRCADQAGKVLERGVPILICGETGVGKEVLVKALHQGSKRRDQPLVSVNCAAIPPELVESELFGYEPGAFTGARAQGSLGLIRKADKGILFLDEIGEMPLAAQSRLLRVLQEREVMPVGSTEHIPVDILLVSATNRPLSTRIESAEFRADLYYRINGLSVELPPLREREDRRQLIHRIYQQHRDGNQADTLKPEVMAALENHPWPGNIRQLVNIIRVAVAIADGEEIELWHLPKEFLGEYGNREEPAQKPVFDPSSFSEAPQANDNSRTDIMKHTLVVYQQCMGNVSRAARELAVSRNTLYKRLRDLGVR